MKPGTFFRITRKELEKANSVYEIAVIAAISYYSQNAERSCFPKVETIAERLMCSKRQVLRAIKSLETEGVLKIIRQHRTANRYKLTDQTCSSKGAAQSPLQVSHSHLSGVSQSPDKKPLYKALTKRKLTKRAELSAPRVNSTVAELPLTDTLFSGEATGGISPAVSAAADVQQLFRQWHLGLNPEEISTHCGRFEAQAICGGLEKLRARGFADPLHSALLAINNYKETLGAGRLSYQFGIQGFFIKPTGLLTFVNGIPHAVKPTGKTLPGTREYQYD